jgi:hypothetical protein
VIPICFSALQSLADFGLGSVLPVTVLRCSRRLDLVEQALDARHLGGHEISPPKNTKMLFIGAMRNFAKFKVTLPKLSARLNER